MSIDNPLPAAKLGLRGGVTEHAMLGPPCVEGGEASRAYTIMKDERSCFSVVKVGFMYPPTFYVGGPSADDVSRKLRDVAASMLPSHSEVHVFVSRIEGPVEAGEEFRYYALAAIVGAVK